MRVCILTDERFAVRERTLLARLEIGLADEGVRVIHAIPQRTAGGQGITLGGASGSDEAASGNPGGMDIWPEAGRESPSDVFSRAVLYSDAELPFTRTLRARRLLRAIRRAEGLEDEAGRILDVVHVMGGRAWGLGATLARLTGAGLALEVWRSGLIDRMGGPWPADVRPVFVAPDPGLERAMLARRPGLPVRSAPWGVHVRERAGVIFDPQRAAAVMMVGAGHNPQALGAALAALSDVMNAQPNMHLFIDAAAARRAKLWPLARTLGLASRLSLVDDLESARDLMVHGDVLIQPESHGEQRSVLLDAMAAGMAVIAAKDPNNAALQDGRTARLVPAGDQKAWRQAVRDVFGDAAAARRLGSSAREYIAKERLASGHVRAVLELYQSLAASPAPASGARA